MIRLRNQRSPNQRDARQAVSVRPGRELPSPVNRICDVATRSGPQRMLIDNAGAQYAVAIPGILPAGRQDGSGSFRACGAINPFGVFRTPGERGCTVPPGSQSASPWCNLSINPRGTHPGKAHRKKDTFGVPGPVPAGRNNWTLQLRSLGHGQYRICARLVRTIPTSKGAPPS